MRKAEALAEAGAQVTVIAPEVDPRMHAVERVGLVEREFRSGDTSGYALVFAATDDRPVNATVSQEAQANGIPVNVVDDPELCSFIVPSVLRRGDLLIAVSTSGKSPALSKKLRRKLEDLFGPEYGTLTDLLGELRDQVKSRYDCQADRDAAFHRLADSDILDLLREGRVEDARIRALELL